MTKIVLTPDQERALTDIVKSVRNNPTDRYVLTGYAGTGKTTLMQHVTRTLIGKGYRVALTAPTHKAVAVLSGKLKLAGLDNETCCTIHSLLSLKPKHNGDRTEFVRAARPTKIRHDVVVVDECSMVDEQLFGHIQRYLEHCFVLFVGDPAQLPPVNERASLTFSAERKSHLETIIRQAQDNPVLQAADAIRRMQGSAPTRWDWCKEVRGVAQGVFVPGEAVERWMKKAFTSPDFDKDADTFRYLAWTNERVDQVNAKVREWRYGTDRVLPFMPGERALIRSPILNEDGDILFRTNEEARVLEIERDTFRHKFKAIAEIRAWEADVPSWRVVLEQEDGKGIPVHMPANKRDFFRTLKRIRAEADECEKRWEDYHTFRSMIAEMHAHYALTVHNSQGSTFRNVFVDVQNIRRREASNLLEFHQLLYVAATRPSHCLVVVGPSGAFAK